MKSAQRTFQNILIESRNVPWLPPLWQVIYSEGIRGNHILFAKKDILAFDQTKRLTLSARSSSEADSSLEQRVSDVVLKLTCCSDLSSMIRVLDAEDLEVKANLFQLYLRTLELWKNMHKTSLN